MSEPKKIRLLIVDESFFMRKLIRQMLEDVADIEVVGEAKNGIEAIGQFIALQPDVITMDYSMPEMNGADATKKILSLEGEYKMPAIIMVSAYVKEGMSESLDCLRAGAFDIIQKPSGELSLDVDTIRDEIIRKIRAGARAHIMRFAPLLTIPVEKTSFQKAHSHSVIIIGSSTGGPPLVENILSHIPAFFDLPIVVIQHMPQYFTGLFAKRLNSVCMHNVSEAKDHDDVTNNTFLIAPGGADLSFVREEKRYSIRITDATGKDGIHPSIDCAMESAALQFGKNAIGVILSGMGEDGAKGAAAIKDQGGMVIVQRPETAVIQSMPHEVIERGLADQIADPDDIARILVELRSRHEYSKSE